MTEEGPNPPTTNLAQGPIKASMSQAGSWRAALLPKKETMAHSFLLENPTYDGRDTVIGILDTGVDPSAAGLQKTTTGLPKVIDLVDCTGSGDVDISTEVMLPVDEQGNVQLEVTGLSGRKLVLNPDWNIADNKVRLGIKAAYELYPTKLRRRVAERRLKLFNADQRRHAAVVRAELEAIEDKEENMKKRENLEELMKVLEEHESPFKKDVGPIFDCVVFFDGEYWRAAIDTEESGDLSQEKTLSDFRKQQQLSIFGTADVNFTYAVNIYDEENVLSIVSDAGAHGTHVAGITSAFHPGDSIVNGVAPGAQIVGLKIGDSRLGSMETGTAFTRCLIESVRRGCDIINLSYGEAVALCNSGRHAKLVRDLVHKHNIIFCSSAGNNGPALSTVGAPGASMDDIISVGAYFSRDMMIGSYSMMLGEDGLAAENYNAHKDGATYTWSSVGPALDGAEGVDIMAPGAAITCVPSWTLQKSQLMNGTSMSSPNLSGCVALLVSACKQNGIPYTAQSIRRAIQSTASFIDGISPLQQGYGMINVQQAWVYLKSEVPSVFSDLKFIVSVDKKNRGIYIRSGFVSKSRHIIEISPTWDEDDVSKHDQRIKAEWQVSIHCSHTWIECPRRLALFHNGRTFNATVNPKDLGSGLHTGSISVIDDITRETIAKVPVTVIVPHASHVSEIDFGEHQFAPAEVKHFFLSPPHGATFVDIHISSTTPDTSIDQTLVLHTIQLLPHSPYRAFEAKKYIALNENNPMRILSIPIESNHIVEICLARYWSSVGDFSIGCKATCRGLIPNVSSLCMTSNRPVYKVSVNSILRDEMLSTSAKLERWKSGLIPKESGTVTLLGPRDSFEAYRQIHQIILNYEYANSENGKITPRIPALQGFLYDSALESQLILCFDENKKLLGVADAWPDEIEVKKGKVIFRVQIRHEDPILLNKFKNLEIFIERKLKEPIVLQTYDSHAHYIDGSVSEKRVLKKGLSKAVFIASPPTAKIPKDVKYGDIFEGNVTFCGSKTLSVGGDHRPGGFPFSFVAGQQPTDNEKKPQDLVSGDEEWPNEFENDLINMKCTFLEKLSDKNHIDYMSAYEKFLADHPSNLSLKIINLRFLESKKGQDNVQERLVELYNACCTVLQQIDEKDLATHFGVHHDKNDKDLAKICKEKEKLKDQLVETLVIKAKTLYVLQSSDIEVNFNETFEDALKKVLRWVDHDSLESKYFELKLFQEAKRPGVLLKCLYTVISDDKPKDRIKRKDWHQRVIKVLNDLQFDHLAKLETSQMIIEYPKKYSVF